MTDSANGVICAPKRKLPSNARPDKWAKAYEMRWAGFTWLEIGAHFGVCEATALQMASQHRGRDALPITFQRRATMKRNRALRLAQKYVDQSFTDWCASVLDSYREALRV